jgi:hypothetical protein
VLHIYPISQALDVPSVHAVVDRSTCAAVRDEMWSKSFQGLGDGLQGRHVLWSYITATDNATWHDCWKKKDEIEDHALPQRGFGLSTPRSGTGGGNVQQHERSTPAWSFCFKKSTRSMDRDSWLHANGAWYSSSVDALTQGGPPAAVTSSVKNTARLRTLC